MSSPWLVEQIAMQGESGVLAYQAIQASCAATDMPVSAQVDRRS